MHSDARKDEADRLDHKYYGQINYTPDIYDKYRHKPAKSTRQQQPSVVVPLQTQITPETKRIAKIPEERESETDSEDEKVLS